MDPFRRRGGAALVALAAMLLPWGSDFSNAMHMVVSASHEHGHEHDEPGDPASALHGHGHEEGTPPHVHGSSLPGKAEAGISELPLISGTSAMLALPAAPGPLAGACRCPSPHPSPPGASIAILRV